MHCGEQSALHVVTNVMAVFPLELIDPLTADMYKIPHPANYRGTQHRLLLSLLDFLLIATI